MLLKVKREMKPPMLLDQKEPQSKDPSMHLTVDATVAQEDDIQDLNPTKKILLEKNKNNHRAIKKITRKKEGENRDAVGDVEDQPVTGK